MHFASSPQAGLPRRWWPLAVSLAVHALLIGLWLKRADLRPLAPAVPEPLSVFLVPAPRALPVPPVPERTARAKPDSKKPGPSPNAAGPRAMPPVEARAPVEAMTPEPGPVAPTAPSAADVLQDGRHEVGKITGQLRAEDAISPLRGKEPGPLRRGGKWARFADTLEAAHIDHSSVPNREAYTAPDGVTYYRTRVGNQYYCRKTGSLDPSSTWKTGDEMHANSMSTLGMGGTSGLVLCPGSERDWKQQ
jgi:hypothetical protein